MPPLNHIGDFFCYVSKKYLENQRTVVTIEIGSWETMREKGYCMDKSERRYLEMGVSGPIVWTQQLQDPSHKEEHGTDFPLSLD